MTRVFPTLTALAVAAPLLASSTSASAQPRTDGLPGARPDGFVASHGEAIAIGASLVAAGIGTGILLWRRRRSVPSDGIRRSEAQRKTLDEALQFEKQFAVRLGGLGRQAAFPVVQLRRLPCPWWRRNGTGAHG